jgi:ribose/xylose/arabinose/galactoside ABC-type transport system permease subunit/ABC-type branched-subunit amino acid transport system ATPase component
MESSATGMLTEQTTGTGALGTSSNVGESPQGRGKRGLVSGLVRRSRLFRRSNQDRPWDFRSRAGLALFCVVMMLVLGAVYDNFLTVSNFFTILLSASAVGIAGTGTMFLLISGNIDLSIGGQYSLIGIVAGICARDTQSTVLTVVTALAGGAILGYINGRLVRLLRINPLIVTLGMGLLLTGLGFVFSNGYSIYGFPSSLTVIGQGHLWQVPVPVIIGAVIFIVCGLLLLRTVFGLRVYAMGGNASATRLVGVNVARYLTSLYVLNGTLIGLVALLSIAQVGTSSPDVGTDFALLVLTAVVLGGVGFNGGSGHPFGVFVGVFTIALLDAAVIFANVASFWQEVVEGAALLIALGMDQLSAYGRQRAATRARGHSLEDNQVVSGARSLVSGEEGPTSVPGADLGSALSPESRRLPQQPASDSRVVLACRGLTKYYGAVCAVQRVQLEVRAGEILCLAGDNGAGKSTLIQMLSGAIRPDSGAIEVEGATVELNDPATARARGITTVYQNLALCPNLGVAENLVLGTEPTRNQWGPLSWRNDKQAELLAAERLGALGVRLIDYRRPVRLLSGGQAQAVAIARVVEPGVKVAVLDEPTAALGFRQSRSVRDLVRARAARGTAVIVISHDVDNVMMLADRIVVLRLGEVILEGTPSTISEEMLIHAMAGYVPKSL